MSYPTISLRWVIFKNRKVWENRSLQYNRTLQSFSVFGTEVLQCIKDNQGKPEKGTKIFFFFVSFHPIVIWEKASKPDQKKVDKFFFAKRKIGCEFFRGNKVLLSSNCKSNYFARISILLVIYTTIILKKI